jgi:hypothetical protein
VPAVVAVAGCILTVLMHACRPELWSHSSRLQARVSESESLEMMKRVDRWDVCMIYDVLITFRSA